MGFSSKDILFLMTEFIFSIFATILWGSGVFSLTIFLVIMGAFLLGGFIIFLQSKINELSQAVEDHDLILRKFEEKFKIHSRLNKLEMKVFNG